MSPKGVARTDSRGADEKPILVFQSESSWSTWLDRNHDRSSGVRLRLAKKASGLTSISYDEVLDVALCYGWIDGQSKSDGEEHWLLKVTPRGKRSIWSKRNRKRVAALTRSGRMRPAGLAEVKRAKKDGRWEAAYDSPSRIAVPGDLEAALNGNARAKSFFATLDSRNRFAILFRIHTAKKAETRTRRIRKFVAMLARKEKLHP